MSLKIIKNVAIHESMRGVKILNTPFGFIPSSWSIRMSAPLSRKDKAMSAPEELEAGDEPHLLRKKPLPLVNRKEARPEIRAICHA